MDDGLLSRLPDRAKLAILAHLQPPISGRAAAVAHSPCLDGSQVLQGAAIEQQEQAAATALHAPAPAALAGRSLPPLSLLVIDGFTDAASVAAARAEASAIMGARSRSAGMGGGGGLWRSSAFRSDRIAFLRPEELQAEGHGLLAALLERLSSTLQPWLAAQGWDVGGRPSFQLGVYSGGGARYCRHADRHPRSAPRRVVSAVLYLQPPGWSPADGGQLVVYDQARPPEAALAHGEAALASGLDAGLPGTAVPPLGGRLVVFDSRLVHEVLPVQRERAAITCWFTCGEEAERSGGGGGGGLTAPAADAAAEQLSSQLATARLQPPPWTIACAAASDSSSSSSREHRKSAPSRPITRPRAIFVSIASFRDPETQWTLADLFAKAADPDLLSVGVVWQVDWERDSHFVGIAALPEPGERSGERQAAERRRRWRRQLRQVVLDAGEATGPCKARALAEQLWQGEEFVLQIDSHMRFLPCWDASLRRQLRRAAAAAGCDRVVLSCYPPGYTGLGAAAELPPAPLPSLLCASHFDPADGLLRLRARKLRAPPAAPPPSRFWAAGLSFARAGVLDAAPYRRDLPGLFHGEELVQLAALRGAGWRVFAPCEVVAFHLWGRAHRPLFWHARGRDGAAPVSDAAAAAGEAAGEAAGSGQAPEQHTHLGLSSGGRGLGHGLAAARVQSLARVRALLEGPQGLALGKELGVDFAARTISAEALAGGLPEDALL